MDKGPAPAYSDLKITVHQEIPRKDFFRDAYNFKISQGHFNAVGGTMYRGPANGDPKIPPRTNQSQPSHMTLFSGASGFEINGGDFSVVGGDYIDMSLPPSPNPPVQPANYGYNQFPSRYSEMTSGPDEYSTTGQAYGQPANTQNAWVPHQHYQNSPVNNVMTAAGATRAHQPNNIARNGNTAGPNEVHHQAILRMPQPVTFPVPETEINRQTQLVGSSPVLMHVASQNDLSHPVAPTSPEAAGPREITSIPAENTTSTESIAAGETPKPETKRSTQKIFRKFRSIFPAAPKAAVVPLGGV